MKTKYAILSAISALVIALDQYTKHLAIEKLQGKNPVDVINGCFTLRYVENPGSAWGFLSQTPSSFRIPFFMGVSILALALLVYYFHKLHTRALMMILSLSMILGGAIGNFIDRARNHYVVDFIDWYYREKHWPTFNIADAAITIGVILMMICILFGYDGLKQSSGDSRGQTGS